MSFPDAPLALALSAAALADVHVVDASGGGDFTTLQAAVNAAADGDTLLVRSGSYDGFLLTGKGLSIVAEP
jgi:pectin methylesterase-like acyl-CoA thioesterase